MVNPADIEKAERFGMPENGPEEIECRLCLNSYEEDDIIQCDVCGKYLCADCRIDIGTFIKEYEGNYVCKDVNHNCVIGFLVNVIGQLEIYINNLLAKNSETLERLEKFDGIAKAAEKAAKTGNHKDLQEYLKLRRQR